MFECVRTLKTLQQKYQQFCTCSRDSCQHEHVVICFWQISTATELGQWLSDISLCLNYKNHINLIILQDFTVSFKIIIRVSHRFWMLELSGALLGLKDPKTLNLEVFIRMNSFSHSAIDSDTKLMQFMLLNVFTRENATWKNFRFARTLQYVH